MDILYPIFIAFFLVFISELGDKTQLLVLSFSTKLKISTIILGVAFGSLFSHGIAIMFGSFLGNINSSMFHSALQIITYVSFLFLGISCLLKKEVLDYSSNYVDNSVKKLPINYIFIIATGIAIGELGDKTFLASIGLGINYPNLKILLIIGAILGMILSDFLAIILGRFIVKKIPENIIKNFSGFLFILFGLLGLFQFLLK